MRPRQSSHTNVRSRFTHNCPKLETTHTCLSAGELLSSAWYLHEWNAAQNKKKEPSGIDPRRGLGWPWADSRPGPVEEESLGNFCRKAEPSLRWRPRPCGPSRPHGSRRGQRARPLLGSLRASGLRGQRSGSCRPLLFPHPRHVLLPVSRASHRLPAFRFRIRTVLLDT